MPFGAALSTLPDASSAVHEACSSLTVAVPDLAIVFFSPHHADDAETIVGTLQEVLAPRVLMGCVGESIIGNDQEIEGLPAVSVWAGKWARIGIDPFHLYLERTSEGFS